MDFEDSEQVAEADSDDHFIAVEPKLENDIETDMTADQLESTDNWLMKVRILYSYLKFWKFFIVSFSPSSRKLKKTGVILKLIVQHLLLMGDQAIIQVFFMIKHFIFNPNIIFLFHQAGKQIPRKVMQVHQIRKANL